MRLKSAGCGSATARETPTDSPWPDGAVREAARRLGVSAEGSETIHVGHCAIVALPALGVAARVGRPRHPVELFDAELRFARLCHHAGLPVIHPADDIVDSPLATKQGPVTLWPLLRPVRQPLDTRWLGRTLRRLHSLAPPEGIVSLWNPLGVVEARVAAYTSRPDARSEYVSLFSAACAEARRVLADPVFVAHTGLVHGDPANVVVTVAGGPILIDFDLAGVGPTSWDLASIAIRERRFGLSRDSLEDFYRCYGLPPNATAAFDALVRVRELLDCSFALDMLEKDGAGHAHDELRIRSRALSDRSDRTPWKPLVPTAGRVPERSGR